MRSFAAWLLSDIPGNSQKVSFYQFLLRPGVHPFCRFQCKWEAQSFSSRVCWKLKYLVFPSSEDRRGGLVILPEGGVRWA